MASYLNQVLAFLSPTYDPADEHFQTVVAESRLAAVDNTEVVSKQVELQRQLRACFDRIAKQNPQLIDLMQTLRGSSGVVTTTEVDISPQEMLVLSKAAAALQADEEFGLIKAQLDRIVEENREKEDLIAALEAELAETKRLLYQYGSVIRTSERNLFGVMSQRQEIQKIQ